MSYRADFLLDPPPAPRFVLPDQVGGHAWIYLHLDADSNALYIGRTITPTGRTRQHEISSPWWDQVADMVWFGPIDEVDAVAVEKELIRATDAPHNVQHTSRAMTARQRPEARREVLEARVHSLRWRLARAEEQLAQIANTQEATA